MAGLSILIPVHNRAVAPLTHALLAQLPAWPGPAEIRLLDDGSDTAFQEHNRPLGHLPGVHYVELPHNVGRAAVRNHLAASARHEWLLLLDNDSLLPDDQFLARYAAASQAGAAVLIGGTCYYATPPTEAALHLRWLYGREREARPAALRQAAPYAQLTINNALVHATILQRFPLDERLTGYGHEDTKFGAELAAAGVPVQHLGNPVIHDGLEPAALFLEKSEQAVRNLALVYRTDGLGGDSRLLQTALRLQRQGLALPARATLAALAPALRRQLLSGHPRLRALDMLKLSWLLQELA